MSRARDLHNKLAGETVRQIVEPILAAGGGRPAILVLTESVVTGVVLFCAKMDALSRDVVFDALVDGVRTRLDDIAKRESGERKP